MISKKLVFLVSVAAMLLGPAVCAAGQVTKSTQQSLNYYNAGDVNGWVVDSATGEPIEGAVVLAFWNVHDADGGVCAGADNLQEVLTGKDGSYKLPGFTVHGACNGLDPSDPRLYVFKPGYAFEVLANVNHGDMRPPIMANQPSGLNDYSDWSNWVIVLARYPELKIPQVSSLPNAPSRADPYKTYEGSLTRFNRVLESIIDLAPKQCNWKKMPNMLRALRTQQMSFIDQGIPVGSIVDSLYQYDKDAEMKKVAPDCGSLHDYMHGIVFSVPPILHPELVDKSGKTLCFSPCPASIKGTVEARVQHNKWKDATGQENQTDIPYYALVLDAPVSVKFTPLPKGLVPMSSNSFDGVKEMQLVFDSNTVKVDSFVNKPVVVDGYLTQATGEPQFTSVVAVALKMSPGN